MFKLTLYMFLEGHKIILFCSDLLNFVEKEADLSGSEGSEDEDEKGLDILEMEEGDLDDIDEDDVRDQVGIASSLIKLVSMNCVVSYFFS